eukprot:UN22776
MRLTISSNLRIIGMMIPSTISKYLQTRSEYVPIHFSKSISFLNLLKSSLKPYSDHFWNFGEICIFRQNFHLGLS